MSESNPKSGPKQPDPAQSALAHAVQQTHPLPPLQMPKMQGVVLQQLQQWTGPLPSPEQLKQFNDVVPGAADRIIKMAEQEGEHARALQMAALTAATSAQSKGQFFAGGIALCGLIATVLLALKGHDWVAGIVGGTTLTTIVVAFLQAFRAEKHPPEST